MHAAYLFMKSLYKMKIKWICYIFLLFVVHEQENKNVSAKEDIS